MDVHPEEELFDEVVDVDDVADEESLSMPITRFTNNTFCGITRPLDDPTEESVIVCFDSMHDTVKINKVFV